MEIEFVLVQDVFLLLQHETTQKKAAAKMKIVYSNIIFVFNDVVVGVYGCFNIILFLYYNIEKQTRKLYIADELNKPCEFQKNSRITPLHNL